MKFATGKNAIAICDRCGAQRPYLELVPDLYKKGLWVCPGCRDTRQEQETPIRTDEGIVLKHPRPNREDDTVVITSGTAQAGAASTITLSAAASALASLFIGNTIELTGGTGSGQERTITDYNGSTKVARVDSAWTTPPDATSTYEVTPSLLIDSIGTTFGGGT